MKYLLICSLLMVTLSGFSQEPLPTDTIPVAKEPSYSFVLPVKKNPYLEGKFRFGALSNSISTSGLLEFTSSSFLTDNDKAALLKEVGSRLRFGYTREIAVGYRAPWYKVFDTYNPGQGFTFRNRFYSNASLSKDLLNLIFYGNKPYAGTTLNLGPSTFESWYFSSLDYHFDVLLDSVQPISLTVSIQMGHDYDYYKLSQGSLYTDPDGAFLDLDLDYRLRDRELNSQPLAGLGISLGGESSFRLTDRSKLSIKVQDLGIMNWNNGRLLDTDSTFRFRGFGYSNIFDINDSLTSYNNERFSESFFYEDRGSYVRLLPFYAEVEWALKSSNRLFSQWFVAADYRYLAGYLPRITAGTVLKTGYHQHLLISVAGGGFTVFSLNAGYSFEWGDNLQLQVRIENLNGLLMPGYFGGAIGQLGLTYDL